MSCWFTRFECCHDIFYVLVMTEIIIEMVVNTKVQEQ